MKVKSFRTIILYINNYILFIVDIKSVFVIILLFFNSNYLVCQETSYNLPSIDSLKIQLDISKCFTVQQIRTNNSGQLLQKSGIKPLVYIIPSGLGIAGVALYLTSTKGEDENTEILRIQCPSNQTVNNIQYNCGSQVNGLIATATGGTGITITNSYNEAGANASAIYPVGNTTITFNALDDSGNSASCRTTITVIDEEDPEMECKDITRKLNEGSVTVYMSELIVKTSDNCGIQNVSMDRPDPIIYDEAGMNQVTLISTDVNGNTSSCISTVTIEDADPLTISCPVSQSTYVDEGKCIASINLQPATVEGGAGTITISNDFNQGGADASGDYPVGTTVVSFTATDDITQESVSCTTEITVVDNEPPTASCQDVILYLDENGSGVITAEEVNSSSTDNCSDINLSLSKTEFNCNDLGENIEILTVTDKDGNTASCEATIIVLDNEPPTINCPSNIEVSVDQGQCSSIVTYDITTNDNCTGETWVQTAGIESGLEFPVGVTTNTFVVTDASGNSSECSFTVTVVDDTSPTAVCQNITVQVESGGSITIAPDQIDNGSTDNCEIVNMELSRMTFSASDESPQYVYLIVTDASDNTDQCVAEVSIEVDDACEDFTFITTESLTPIVCETSGELLFSVASPNGEAVRVKIDAPGAASFTGDLTAGLYRLEMPWVGAYNINASIQENNAYCVQSYTDEVIDDGYILNATIEVFDNFLVGNILIPTVGPYNWYLNDSLVTTTTTTFHDYINPLPVGMHTAYVTDNNGCASTTFTFDITAVTGETSHASSTPDLALYLSTDNPVYPLPEEDAVANFEPINGPWIDYGVLNEPDNVTITPYTASPNLLLEVNLHPNILFQSQFSIRKTRADYQFNLNEFDPVHASNFISGIAGIESFRFYLDKGQSIFLSPGMGWNIWNVDNAFTLKEGATYQYQSDKQITNVWGYFSSGFRIPISKFTSFEVSTSVIQRKDVKGDISKSLFGLIQLFINL